MSVAGIVFDEHDRVLAIRRRDNGQWQPPGGVLELDETFEEGVQREVLEETGQVEIERLTGVYKNIKLGIVALVFRCSTIEGTPQATDESREVRWLDLPEAVALMPPTFAIRVQDACHQTAPYRVHDGIAVFDRS